MKKNFIVTPQFMSEFNQGDSTPWLNERTNYTGFVFLAHKTTENFFTCSCGEQGAIPLRKHCCPHCGGELFDRFCCRKTIDSRCPIDRWEIKQTSKSRWEFYYHWRTVNLNGTSGEYTLQEDVDKIGSFNLPYSLNLTKAVKRINLQELLKYLTENIPEVDLIMKVVNVSTSYYWYSSSSKVPYEEFIQGVGKNMESCGITAEELRSYYILYGIYFSHKVRGVVPERSLHDYLQNNMGADDESIRFMMQLFKDKIKVDSTIADFATNPNAFKTFCSNVQACVLGKYPNSGFVLDLLSRDVINLYNFSNIMQFFADLKQKKPFRASFRSAEIAATDSMVFDFAEFLKKNSARKCDIVQMFGERATKLYELGYPIILENLLDKNYYALLNASAYSTPNMDFEEDFKRDPLQCMKDMK